MRNFRKTSIIVLALVFLTGNIKITEAVAAEKTVTTNNISSKRLTLNTDGENLVAPLKVSSSEEAQIKKVIYDGLSTESEAIDVTAFCNGLDDANEVMKGYFWDVMYENNDIFYIASYSATYSTSNGKITSFIINPIYVAGKDEIVKMKQEVLNVVNNFKANYIKDSYTDFQKEYAAVRYIIDNCTYDEEEFAYSKNNNGKSLKWEAHSSYGSLVKGIAVCDGYSDGVKYLLNSCGIEVGRINSSAIDHAWNYVKLNNNYYQLDSTWADTSTKKSEPNIFKTTGFNETDSDMTVSHKYVVSSLIPKCDNDDYEFFRENYIYTSNTLTNYDNETETLYYLKDGVIYAAGIYGENATALYKEENIYKILGKLGDEVIYVVRQNGVETIKKVNVKGKISVGSILTSVEKTIKPEESIQKDVDNKTISSKAIVVNDKNVVKDNIAQVQNKDISEVNKNEVTSENEVTRETINDVANETSVDTNKIANDIKSTNPSQDKGEESSNIVASLDNINNQRNITYLENEDQEIVVENSGNNGSSSNNVKIILLTLIMLATIDNLVFKKKEYKIEKYRNK